MVARLRPICLSACWLVLASCAVAPGERAHQPLDLPAAYVDVPLAAAGGGALAQQLHAPELSVLLARAFAANPTLRQAWSRVERAEAVQRQARAARLPQLELSGEARRSRAPLFLPGQVGSPGGGGTAGAMATAPGGSAAGAVDADELARSAFLRNQFELGLGAGFEVDLWGRLRHSERAAALDAIAMRRDAESMAVTLAAEVALAWVDLAANRERGELLAARRTTTRQMLELTRMRFEQGQLPATEVHRQQQQLDALRAARTRNDAQRVQVANRLALLLGQPPRSAMQIVQQAVPELPAVEPGAPADLLARRPDLRAASLRLQAADLRVAASLAERLPALRLNASVFDLAQQLGELFGELFWSVGATADISVFDGGRRRARHSQAEATATELLHEYAELLLQALREVQDALSLGRQQQAFLEHTAAQLQGAERMAELARRRFTAGSGDYLDVLGQRQRIHELGLELVDARRELFALRLQLWRALGGGWAQQAGAGELTDER